MLKLSNKKAYIILATGEVLEGVSIGVSGTTIGEIVFNTGMVGYQETLTDPSYFGQIITQTYPMIGNYGINDEDAESEHIWASGYIVREVCDMPSNFRCKITTDAFLKAHNIIGIQGIDTRKLTRLIRESGVMNGAITTEYTPENKGELLEKIKAYTIVNAVETVTSSAVQTVNQQGKFHVVLMDYGYKANILRNLVKRDCRVTILPAKTPPAQILNYQPDGIMLSNGPGDPAENIEIIENLKMLITSNVPIFGICLGHQLIALARGAKTEKLKYGHRGVNQPVTDIFHDRTYITSQNHGYCVVGSTLDLKTATISHFNANDQSVEGVRYRDIPCFTVQFHPEACGGPKDTEYLFDEFITLMQGGKE